MGEVGPPSSVEVISRECLGVRLRILTRAVNALFDDALRPLGVRVGQLNLLVVIARIGTAKAGDLCRALRMDKSTLSRDLEVLRRNGWLEEVEGVGRGRPLRASAGGLALIESALPAWRTAQAGARTLLGEEASAAIARAVDGLWSGSPEAH